MFLRFGGEKRELITKEKAEKLLEEFKKEKKEWKESKSIQIGGQSYNVQSAMLVAEDLLSQLTKLEIIDLSDIIAGRPEEEALQILTIFSNSLKGIKFLEINLSDNALGLKGNRIFYY